MDVFAAVGASGSARNRSDAPSAAKGTEAAAHCRVHLPLEAYGASLRHSRVSRLALDMSRAGCGGSDQASYPYVYASPGEVCQNKCFHLIAKKPPSVTLFVHGCNPGTTTKTLTDRTYRSSSWTSAMVIVSV